MWLLRKSFMRMERRITARSRSAGEGRIRACWSWVAQHPRASSHRRCTVCSRGASQTQFKFFRSTTVGQSSAAIYDFKVLLPNSDWFVKVGGQSLRPAYSGSVWIDRSTAQVRRIEMQADKIPQDFPLDSVQWAVDYDERSARHGIVPAARACGEFELPTRVDDMHEERGRFPRLSQVFRRKHDHVRQVNRS